MSPPYILYKAERKDTEEGRSAASGLVSDAGRAKIVDPRSKELSTTRENFTLDKIS
jgi:hypothetical protein